MTTLRELSAAEQREAYLAAREQWFKEGLGPLGPIIQRNREAMIRLEKRQRVLRVALVCVWLVFVLALVATVMVNL